jgi:hypothetical protein
VDRTRLCTFFVCVVLATGVIAFFFGGILWGQTDDVGRKQSPVQAVSLASMADQRICRLWSDGRVECAMLPPMGDGIWMEVGRPK